MTSKARRSNPLGIYPQMIESLGGRKAFSLACPHCKVTSRFERTEIYFGKDADGDWAFSGALCPSCNHLVLYLERGDPGWLTGGSAGGYEMTWRPAERRLIRPEFVLPEPIPKETPPEIVKDYEEAAMVLGISPNASAALSRRCLQNIIREIIAQDIKDFEKGELYDEISQVLDSKVIPNENLNKMLHKVRIVGNFGAHSIKSKYTGLIIDVELSEAEFNINVIGRLLYWYYSELPAERKIIEDIDQKQEEAEKIRRKKKQKESKAREKT